MIFGHVLEERSVIGSQEAIEALGKLTRSSARLITADGSLREVDNAELKPGDQVEVRAGDRVPADGRVLEGRASLDTAPITGESPRAITSREPRSRKLASSAANARCNHQREAPPIAHLPSPASSKT
eukprot:gene39357-biopygen26282